MSKSAIYATVKTLTELILPLAGGLVTVWVYNHYGSWPAVGIFVFGVLFNIFLSWVGEWFLKKMNIPNY